MKYELFSVNENGKLGIKTKELLTINSFKTIIERDTHKPKERAFKELAYIWFIADYDSPTYLKGLKGKRADEFAKEKVGLPKYWKADEVVLQGIKDYTDCQADVVDDLISEILNSFSYYSRIVVKVRKSIENIIYSDAAITKDQAKELTDLISGTLSMANSIPAEVSNLKKAVGELRRNDNNEDRDFLRGTDETVPDSADPDTDY